MANLYIFPLSLCSAGDIQQTPQVAPGENSGAGGQGMMELISHHLAGDFRHFGAECTAKTTADFALLKFVNFNATQFFQQLSWLRLDIQFA
jgi:hypothetical protein